MRVVLLSLGLNCVFTLLSVSWTALPRDRLVRKVAEGFASADLTEEDYLPFNADLGWHQYNDCNILQMLTNADSSAVGQGLGPWLHSRGPSGAFACSTLRELVVDNGDPEGLFSFRYTRYWHGYLPVSAVVLSVFEISSLRQILRGLTYLSVFALLIAGLRRRALAALALPVGTVGALFWALPYFGTGLSHGLGDSTVMLGIAGLVLWHRQLAPARALFPFCAAFGSLVVFFEMLTGPLPTAAGLLFPTAYLAARVSRPNGSGGEHFRLATGALLAFALGAIITILSRLALAGSAVQPSGLDAFFGNLWGYATPMEGRPGVPGFLLPLGRLLIRGEVLTYGSSLGLAALYSSSAAAGLGALWLARREGTSQAWLDFSAFAIGAASVPAWAFLLPTHTYVHAPFMARILIVPIALGWAAFLWQWREMDHIAGPRSQLPGDADRTERST